MLLRNGTEEAQIQHKPLESLAGMTDTGSHECVTVRHCPTLQGFCNVHKSLSPSPLSKQLYNGA